MLLDDSEVADIAHLARLKIEPAQVPKVAAELSKILDLVEQMNTVDTDHLDPMAHPIKAAQPLRADEVSEVNARERFQRSAPAVRAGLYLVPKVIE